jgi:hypothetical protein
VKAAFRLLQLSDPALMPGFKNSCKDFSINKKSSVWQMKKQITREGTEMKQYISDSCVIAGHLTLDNLPFSDHSEVKVIVIPKVKLSEMSFSKAREMAKGIRGSLSDDICKEREER